jgi:hypothetical protein
MATKEPERVCRQIEANKDGILFRSCNASTYISLNVHRSASGTRHAKSLWTISRDDECHMFCEAEWSNWSDGKGNYWAISKDGQVVIGKQGERVAFFDGPGNVLDPWHGYPVGPPSKTGVPTTRRPPKELIDRWMDSGWIKYVTYARLMSNRI